MSGVVTHRRGVAQGGESQSGFQHTNAILAARDRRRRVGAYAGCVLCVWGGYGVRWMCAVGVFSCVVVCCVHPRWCCVCVCVCAVCVCARAAVCVCVCVYRWQLNSFSTAHE